MSTKQAIFKNQLTLTFISKNKERNKQKGKEEREQNGKDTIISKLWYRRKLIHPQ
jgi:hypothetical protein